MCTPRATRRRSPDVRIGADQEIIATMQPAPVLAAAVAAAAATAFAVLQFAGPASSPTLASQTDDTQELRQKIVALEREVASLRTAVAAAPAAADVQRTAAATLTDEQIEREISRWLAQHGQSLALPTAGKADGDAAIDVAGTHEGLRGKSDYWNHADIYKRLFAAGKMDELIAQFEQFATANPKDPQAQMDLGNAYLAYLQLDNSKWPLSMKADEAFDRVLAIDENHWGARFTKAMSYTFWPDFLGKKKEAIAHFERLVTQQSQMPARPEFAQTYLYLGNLQEQRGEAEKARQTWQRGLQLHPDNAELKKKLAQ